MMETNTADIFCVYMYIEKKDIFVYTDINLFVFLYVLFLFL